MSGVEEALMRAAAEAVERIASCHEVVSCPRCAALRGQPCRHVLTGRTLEHPHRERWTLVQPSR